jgi:hypothetical protein
MNPYLEREGVWQDFHDRFIPAAAEALLPEVLPNYIVQVAAHACIHELPAGERRLVGRPGITAKSNAAAGTGVMTESGRTTLTAPAQVRLPIAVDIERHPYVEIRDRDGERIVTVIDLLSPSNKRPGADREQYLAKREEFFQSRVHFVEIDLLRGGPRLPVEGLPFTDYYVLVSRSNDRPNADFWPIKFREKLPLVPIPLEKPDRDAQLDLQRLLHRVYDAAGYEHYIYRTPPQPPLNEPDATWAQQYVPAT